MMKVFIFGLVVIALCGTITAQQKRRAQNNGAPILLTPNPPPTLAIPSPFKDVDMSNLNDMTTQCLDCICDDYAGELCDIKEICGPDSKSCDLLGFSYKYWTNSYNQTNAQVEPPTDPDAYINCKRDPTCAGNIVVQTMVRNSKKDCNGDGVVDCFDYALIHFYGEEYCTNTVLQGRRKNRFQDCVCRRKNPTNPDICNNKFGGLYGNAQVKKIQSN